MINIEEFREQAHRLVDWMAEYYRHIESYPVKSTVSPGEIMQKLPRSAPEKGESIDAIFNDFKKLILPGMSHWQSPGWMAYFPANSSYPSVLAEMLTATLGAQCMLWETSPAAAELEERMMEWLREAMGIPDHMTGVIQDTASTATLCALLSAREKYSDFSVSRNGFDTRHRFRVYCSSEAHSSVDKAVRIAGLGQNHLVKVPVDKDMAMMPKILEEWIRRDIDQGFIPLAVIATLGTTGTLAFDPLRDIARICRNYDIWLHADAAYAGSATILPEWRWIIDGLEEADSYVFNPHKWLFTNFDLSAYYVKEKDILLKTFSILPEYLKTDFDKEVNNYRDWGIQLGRRFRALKLWFVLRNYGLGGIREVFRDHINHVSGLSEKMSRDPLIEIMAPVCLNMICFRFNTGHLNAPALNELNESILKKVNASGKVFLTHTKINGEYAIRLIAGQTHTNKRHLDLAWDLLLDAARKFMKHD